MIKQILAVDLEETVGTEGLTVVKFGATWCGACKAIQPAFEAIAETVEGVKCVEMDADANTDFVVGLGIKSLPAFGFYKDGQKVSIEKGLTAATLKSKIIELL